ncbi:gliding motility lipoprotein GldH [Pedobacter sp. JCM 36344]|uniref:gliding motility lipoprotein GldH n=1 Tax=Pedobacter sp. JCM 36344 TaxID=3374280 RepID=UPI00397E8175
MNNVRVFRALFPVFILFFCGCDTNNLVDNNLSMPSHNWGYDRKIKAVIDVADPAQPFNVYFKLRNTGNYRYSNIFVLLHISGGGMKKQTRRFEYKLAETDGQWTGSGSGNLFTSRVSMITGYKFPNKGKYLLEIEQNMRDNPLHEISDAGIEISK